MEFYYEGERAKTPHFQPRERGGDPTPPNPIEARLAALEESFLDAREWRLEESDILSAFGKRLAKLEREFRNLPRRR